MIIRSFEEAEEIARKGGPKKISVLRAENREFLLALKEAQQRGYGEPVLIGDEKKIREIAEEIRFDISKFAVIDSRDPREIAERGVQLAVTGETDFILRGYIDGPPLYRSLIRASSKGGLKKQICVVALMKFPVLPKLIGLTDTGITVAPDFGAKMEIIRHAVDLFSRLGYQSPQVGIMAARRGLNDEIDSVLDAGRIREAFAGGHLPGCCLVDGLSLSDFFLGKEGFLEGLDEVGYHRIPDILVVHNLEFGNIFVKIDSLAERDFFSGVRRHGIIMGAGIPTVIPSRADTHKTIITDIALGVLIS
jgi:phosphate butyryltransferase